MEEGGVGGVCEGYTKGLAVSVGDLIWPPHDFAPRISARTSGYFDEAIQSHHSCYGGSMNYFFAMILSLVLLGAGCTAPPLSSPVAPEPSATLGSASLDLSGRGLTAIPAEVFSRGDLERLDLSNNKLTGAPSSRIAELKRLKHLDLSKNSLTGLPAELGRLDKLEVLNVSNNQLTGLPMEIGNLTQLKVLDVSGNAYSVQDLERIAAKLTATTIRR